jgi:TP901 family phage tail tape measure protein
MAWDMWSVGVTITAATNADKMFTSIGNQARMASINADIAAGSINKAGAAAQRNQLKLAAANQRLGQMAGMASGAVAVLGGILMTHGVTAAAQMELAMTTVGVATGATTDQMKTLGDMVVHVSGLTAQSASTIAQEMATAARAGLNSFDRLRQSFTQIAKFADVQYFAAKAAGRNADPVEMVSVAAQFSHYFQSYSEQSKVPLSHMLDDLGKVMFSQPEAIQRLLAQGKYFIPLATRLGMPEPEVMDFLASMGQTGFLRGKGGTGVQNTLLGAINVATMTAHLQGARLRGLIDLGLIDKSTGKKTFLDANGNVDTNLLFGMLTAAATHMQSTRFVGDLSNVFGKQATQFLSVFTGPAVQQQLTFIKEAMDRMGTVAQMFAHFFRDLIPQVQRFTTNFTNILINIFRPALPYLTAMFTGLANVLGAIGDWFAAHPKAGLATAIAGFGVTALAAAYAVKQLFNLNLAIDSLAANAKANALLLNALKPVAPVGAAVVGAGVGASAFPLASSFPASVTGTEVAAAVTASGATLATLGAVALRFAGWVGVIIGALKLFQSLPDIGVAIHNWWATNRTQVIFNIGFAFGSIGRAIIDGIQAFQSMVILVVGSIFSNPIMLQALGASMVGQQGTAATLYSQAVSDAIRKAGWSAGTTKSAKDIFLRGALQGITPPNVWESWHTVDDRMPRVELHGDMHVNINGGPIADPKKHAAAVVGEMVKLSRHALHSGASIASLPDFSHMEFATS